MTLRKGSKGEDVRALQAFLKSEGIYSLAIDGDFGNGTGASVALFQGRAGLKADQEAGPATLAAMRALGLRLPSDTEPTLHPNGLDRLDEAKTNPAIPSGMPPALSPDWMPPRPAFGPMSVVERNHVFGAFSYKLQADKSTITIDQKWVDANIVHVVIPQLLARATTITGAPRDGRIACHRLAAPRFLALFAAWDAAGLMDRLRSYGGCWTPRLIRRNPQTGNEPLSEHAHAAAVDLNVAWNGLGQTPAKVGAVGCVRELVPIANQEGFFWLGHGTLCDAMHFGVAKL